MVSKKKLVIQVTFSPDDQKEMEMYEYLKGVGNASGHIKRLIYLDMVLGKLSGGTIEVKPNEETTVKEMKEEDLGFSADDLGGICG